MIQGSVVNGAIPQGSLGNQIYNNVFYNNNRIQDFVNNAGALNIRESSGRSVRDNLIANNIFFRNAGWTFGSDSYTITINHYDNSSAWPVGSLNGNVIKNNIFLRQPGSAGTTMLLRIRNGGQGGNLSYTLPGFQQTYAAAVANFESDPMFMNESTRVFTLRSGSPAIDRGVVMPGIGYLGTAPDLGANEYDGGAPPPPPPADTTPPTVALTAPSAGQSVSGTMTIRASASDNVGVTRIDYLQDGQVLGVLSPPVLPFARDTAAVSNGAHTLTARAYDAAGHVATSAPVAVTVAHADITKPTVAITTPTASPTYTASSSALTLGGTAADAVGVTQVAWANSRGGSGTATGTTSWSASGIVLQDGPDGLTMTAREAAGNLATRTLTVTFSATLAFTDDPLVAQRTLSRAVHITELRAAINSARVARGLATFAWTDPTLTAGSTPVKVVHVAELRAALNQAYQAAGRTAPAYTDPTVAGQLTLIKAIHLNEIRAAVRNIN